MPYKNDQRKPAEKVEKSSQLGSAMNFQAGSPAVSVQRLTPQVQATKSPAQPGQVPQQMTAASTMPKTASISFTAFSDEFEKLAKSRLGTVGKIRQFLETGRKKGFFIDKNMVSSARKSHGSVRSYLASPEGKLPFER